MTDPTKPDVVVVPDADDLGMKREPLSIKTKTDFGEVRPVVIPVLLNREMKRKLLREMKKRGVNVELHADPAPVVTKPRLTARETTARMADELIAEYQLYRANFPMATLKQYLDERTSKTMEEAWKQGKPLDREAVRAALGALWQSQLPRNAETAKN